MKTQQDPSADPTNRPALGFLVVGGIILSILAEVSSQGGFPQFLGQYVLPQAATIGKVVMIMLFLGVLMHFWGKKF